MRERITLCKQYYLVSMEFKQIKIFYHEILEENYTIASKQIGYLLLRLKRILIKSSFDFPYNSKQKSQVFLENLYRNIFYSMCFIRSL